MVTACPDWWRKFWNLWTPRDKFVAGQIFGQVVRFALLDQNNGNYHSPSLFGNLNTVSERHVLWLIAQSLQVDVVNLENAKRCQTECL